MVLTELTRCLTIKPPWDYAILRLGKDVENRTWPTNYRGTLVLHAGVHFDRLALQTLEPFRSLIEREGFRKVSSSLTRGAIVGLVDVIDCVRGHQSRWAEQHPGLFHWVLSNPRSLRTPIPHVGQQAIYPLPDAVLRAIEESL